MIKEREHSIHQKVFIKEVEELTGYAPVDILLRYANLIELVKHIDHNLEIAYRFEFNYVLFETRFKML